MLIDSSLNYAEEANPNDFVVDDGETSYFMNAWKQARIMENPDAEAESLAETARISRASLLLEYPDKAEMINKYSVYEAPIGDKVLLSKTPEYNGMQGMRDRLERDRFEKYFNDGLIYMDAEGVVQSNTPALADAVAKDQANLAQYWEFRQMTDGTQHDTQTLKARNVARMQNELIRLRKQARGADSLTDELASMAGTMLYTVTEPEVLATMVGGAGNVGKGVAVNAGQAFAKEFGLSLVADAIMQPKIMQWRRKLYDPSRGIEYYSTLDAVQTSLVNAGFAGFIQGGGSLVVDGATKFKFRGTTASGRSKFSVVDKYRSKREVGTKKATELDRKYHNDARVNRADVEDALSRSNQFNEKVGDELVDEVVEMMESSPSASMGKHANDIQEAQEHIEAGTEFGGDLHVPIERATTNDFINVKRPDGETVVVRVSDSDDTHLAFADKDGNMVIIDRSSGIGDVDGWSISTDTKTVDMGEGLTDVNQANVEDILKTDDVDHDLIKAHSEDEVILRYNKGQEETVQKLVDEGCLTVNDLQKGNIDV